MTRPSEDVETCEGCGLGWVPAEDVECPYCAREEELRDEEFVITSEW